MTTINEVSQKAEKNGFTFYGGFNEGQDTQHDILTCLRGRFSGEVIDVWYSYITGVVQRVEISTQFPGQESTFVL